MMRIVSASIRERAFRSFLLGDALTLIAMSVGQVALPWWITLENGVHDLALYSIVSAGVACLAVPAMATLADRSDKRALLRAGLAAYSFSSMLVALLAGSGRYDIRLLLALDVIGTAGLSLATPVASVIATEILPPETIARGLQKQRFWQSAGQLTGPLIGGGALAWGGVTLALWAQFVMSTISLALLWRIPAANYAAPSGVAGRPWLEDLTAGLRAKWRIALERNWTLISFLVGIFLVPSMGMLLPLKVRSLGLAGEWLGICEAAIALGLLAGAAAGMSARLIRRVGRYRLRFVAATLLGPLLALAGCSSRPLVLTVALAGAGVMNSIVVMMGYSRRILATPANFRTRMIAVNMTLTHLAALAGPALAAILLVRLSVAEIYSVFGFCLLFCSVGYALTPDFRTFLSLPDAQVEGWYEGRYPEAFKRVLNRAISTRRVM